MWCLPSFRSVPVLQTTVIQTFAQCARERRASRLCSRACAVLSLVCRLADSCSSSQLAACRAGLSAGRGRVRLTSIDFSGASRQSGQAFGAVTACGWRLPWTARERMRIVDLVSTCRYSADEEDEQEGEEEEEEDGGKSFKKVSSDDGWAFNVCTTLFTPHSLYSY